jgi:hypothetical protein
MPSTTISPPSAAETEALIKEARQRRRRRWLFTSLGALVALAAVVTVLATGTSKPQPARRPRRPVISHLAQPVLPAPIPASLDTTVLMWPDGSAAYTAQGGPPAYLDDLTTGRLSQQAEPAIGAGDYQPLLITTGHSFVYVGGDGTTAIGTSLRGRPLVLGTTPFFAPSAAPGRVWLVNQPRQPGPDTVRSVPVTGGPPGPPVELPAGAQLIRGTDAGLLLASRSGALQLWNPGSKPRTLPYWTAADEGADAGPRLVAYGTSCSTAQTSANDPQQPEAGYDNCRVLRVFDVTTGRLTSFPAPPGTAGWVPGGFGLTSAIAPSGQVIAAYAALAPQGQGRTRLYLARLTSPHPQVTAVPYSAAFLFARTAWSAADGWLLYQGPGTHLWAYQVATGQVRSSSAPCCQYTVMAAVKSS